MNPRQLFVLLLVVTIVKIALQNQVDGNGRKVLSRKKRFLIFPEGSSLQLVYCLTIPSLGMGNIFTMGWTAALAWELPHEPIHPYKKKESATKRIDQVANTTSGGWTLHKAPITNPNPYIKSHPMNPGYTKLLYGGNPDTSYREYFKGKYVDYRPIYEALSIKPYRKSNKVNAEPIYSDLHPVYREVHRRTRRDLFSKIEKFLTAQRLDGKACLLKAVCEVAQRANEKGSFMEEILKAIFRIKPYKNERNGDEFDNAADESHNCTQKYSRCSSSIWSLL